MPDSFAFDQRYYDRYYRDEATRVASPATTRKLADFVCCYLIHADLPVRTVLDLGCGLGFWRDAILRHFPDAAYTGVELSAYTCEQFGWRQGSVVDYEAPAPADVLICQGVLQYLGDADCRQAIGNLARLTGGALYLEALTVGDWAENCDQSVTDGSVYLRPGNWYRRHLKKHGFTNCGGGVFLAPSADAVLFELERLE